MEIPVYLFTGFFEAGKTRMIQETLTDARFNQGENTLVLMCEEGFEAYDFEAYPNIFVEYIPEIDWITPKYLTNLEKKYKIERVMVEYNGMWPIDELFRNIPRNWMVYQEMMVADSNTFISYNANMRQQMVDKLQGAEMIIFNRPERLTQENKDEIHRIVRGVSRKAQIAYDYMDGSVEYDETVDPLPFDIDSPVIAVADKDFAIFYRDLMEETEKYIGKTVLFKGLVARHDKLGKSAFLIGRHVMVCCAEDISYKPIVCEAPEEVPYETNSWLLLEAKIEVYKHKLYKNKGPVLRMVKATPAPQPEQEVATFY